MTISGIQILSVHSEGTTVTYFSLSPEPSMYFSAGLIPRSFQYDLKLISKLKKRTFKNFNRWYRIQCNQYIPDLLFSFFHIKNLSEINCFLQQQRRSIKCRRKCFSAIARRYVHSVIGVGTDCKAEETLLIP